MRKKNMIAAAAVLAAAMIGGIWVMGKIHKLLNVNEEALSYMEKKYGEKFTYIKPTGSLMSFDSRSILVSCESMPGREIYVHIEKSWRGETYGDNYMDYYFAPQVERYITDIANGYFEVISFSEGFINTSSYPEENLATTFEEHFFDKKYFVIASMEIGATDEATMREFAAELVRRGRQFSLYMDIPSLNESYRARYSDSEGEMEFYRRK